MIRYITNLFFCVSLLLSACSSPSLPTEPTAVSTLTPYKTLAPTQTMTPTASPAPEISLAEINELLNLQYSFHFCLQSTAKEAGIINYEGVWVNEPRSIHTWFLGDAGEREMESIIIGSRVWTFFPDRFWLPETLEAGLPGVKFEGYTDEESLKTFELIFGELHKESIALSKALIYIVSDLLANLFPDQSAVFTGETENIDGINAAKYTWTNQEDLTIWYVFIDTDRGLPIKLMQMDNDKTLSTYHFSNFNDPGNVIEAPTTHFPEKIHIDDARMALNSLENYQYSISLIFDSSLLENNPDYPDLGNVFIEGSHIQKSNTWQSLSYENENMSDDPFRVLCNGQNCWYGSYYVNLFDKSEYVDSLKLYYPFYIWQIIEVDAEGVLESKNIPVNDYLCDKYIFDWKGENDNLFHLDLFVKSGSMIPIKAELSTQGVFKFIWEISHINDPANNIEIPSE